MSPLERDDLILEAALEWGADAMFDIRPGTLGLTLYAHCDLKEDASYLRKKIPLDWHGLYTIVTYNTDPNPPRKDPYADFVVTPKLK